MKKIYYLLFIAVLFRCETEITPELDQAEEIMVVDAWVNQKMERQVIKIIRSQPYFENSEPQKIPDALVTIEDLDDGTIYQFQEGEKYYHWDPVNEPFGIIGHTYRLTVMNEGETFEAYSVLGRVPPVDSIRFNYSPDDLLVKEEHYKAEFLATDPVGIGDAYWIKTWKNGEYLGKPSEVNIAFDAGFTPSQTIDGVVFNFSIRQDMINPLDEIPDKQNEFYPPYLVGDSVYVEIHSMDPAAFDYLWAVWAQTVRPGGFAELFAYPLANVNTNLKSTDINSMTNVAGFFNVGSVSTGGKRLTQEMADKAKDSAEK